MNDGQITAEQVAKEIVTRQKRVCDDRKPTNLELEARVAQVELWLSSMPGLRKNHLHQMAWEAWKVSWRTCDRYTARARLNLIKRAQVTKEDLRIESLNFYQAILLDKRATTMEKIRARTRIDELFGVDAPKWYKQEHSGPNGAPIPVEDKTLPIPKERLKELIELAERGKATPTNGNGHTASNGNGTATPR